MNDKLFWSGTVGFHAGEALPDSVELTPEQRADYLSGAAATSDSEAAKRELEELDRASIRDLRAYIAARADAPQTLKDREALAVAARARVKA